MPKRGGVGWPGAVEEDNGVRWETKLTGRAHMVVTGGRKYITARMHNPKEKAPFGVYAKVA
jgi:hypothetical protein